jgi:hypothetical protein
MDAELFWEAVWIPLSSFFYVCLTSALKFCSRELTSLRIIDGGAWYEKWRKNSVYNESLCRFGVVETRPAFVAMP